MDLQARLTAGQGRLHGWLDGTLTRQRALALVAVVGLVALLVGWWVLGSLVPVRGGRATPADLDAQWRSLYVQTAADAYIRENDVARARIRLRAYNDSQLAASLSELANDPAADAVSRSNVSELARALSITLTQPALLPAPSLPGGAWPWLALLLVAAVLLGVGAWLVRSGLRHQPVEPWPAASGSPATTESTAARPGTRGRGPAPWRPGRIYLGDTITVAYRAGEEAFYQSYLVHDARGMLVGSVSLQSQQVGSVNTLEIWLVERDEDGSEGDTPLVTFAARSAAEDGVFRARLSDRQLVAATTGARALLDAHRIALDIRLRSVEPDPERGELQLTGLTLSLTADRPAESPDESLAEVDVDPPVPLSFRPD